MRRGAAKLVTLILVTAITAAGVAVWSSSGSNRIRNVLIISIDTCRADHLSCYGFHRPTTPNIDAIAGEGVMFLQAQTTNPLTLPAHSSMMTGTIPPVHGVLTNQGHRLGDANLTLAEVLRENAFQTGAVVGAFPMESRFGLNQGFDSYDDDFGADPKSGFLNERSAEAVSLSATRWLDQRDGNPFFLFVHYYDPHQRFLPPEPFATEYPKDKYSGEIAYTDHCIGKVIAKLKELGLYDSTAIIITSDHGESLGDHLEVSHGFFIYQPTIRIPLVVRTPGCEKGRKVESPVSLVDIMPTTLGMLGLDTPPDLQGIDLTDCIHGGDEPPDDRFLYSVSWSPAKIGCCPLRGLRQREWRYIWSLRPELYNLKQDPGETNNVFADNPSIAQRLDHELKDILALAKQSRVGDGEGAPAQDQQTLERLQSLGYVGGGEVESLSEIKEGMNDPKDYVRVLNQYTMAMTYKSENRLEDAKAECFKIMAAEPRMLHAHLLLGEIATTQGDVANAIKHYDDVLTIAAAATQPDTLRYEITVAHTNLGQLSFNNGEFSRAKGHFKSVLEIDPADVDAQMGLAELYAKEGDTLQATTAFEAILASNPRHIDALYELGKLHLVQSDPAQARSYLEKVLAIDPKHPKAHRRLAKALEQQGNVREAVERLKQGLRLRPDSIGVNNDLAWLLATTSDSELRDATRAVELARHASKLSGRGKPSVLDTLAVVLAAAGDFPAAITTAKEAITLAETTGQTQVARRIRDRLELFEQSLSYPPKPPAGP